MCLSSVFNHMLNLSAMAAAVVAAMATEAHRIQQHDPLRNRFCRATVRRVILIK